ncbi:ribonuclease H-like domain-containing protein [Tanacetum coccineum]
MVKSTKGNGPASVSTDTNGVIKILTSDVKGSTGSSSSAQNVAFVSSESTSSTNDVSTAYGVSTSSGYNSQRENSSSYTDELMYSFFANQSSGPQLDHEDLEQLDEFDLEEMDLKWQVAMILIRLKKFYKKTGRRLQFDAKEPVGFDKTKVECSNCQKLGHFARECVDWTGLAEDEQENFPLMAYINSGSDTEMSTRDKFGLVYGDQVHEGILSYEKEVLESVFDSRLSDVEDSPIHNRFANIKGMHAIPPPMTGNYIPSGPDRQVDDSIVETLEYVSHLIKDYDFHEKRMAKQVELNKKKGKGTGQGENRLVWNNVQRLNHQNKFVPKVVLTKTGIFSINTARQNPFSQAAETSTARKVNTARQNPFSQAAETSTARKVNTARPIMNEIRPEIIFISLIHLLEGHLIEQ